MKARTIYKIALILCISWSMMLPLYAGQTGKIAGKVIDAETNEGLPGANVIVAGTTRGAATNLQGEFIILNLPPGRYTLKASMIGYQVQTMQDVVVQVDLTTKVSFTLSSTVLELGEEVVVTANKEMITKDMTATQATVGAGEINLLPVEEVGDVVKLQTGVVQGRDGKLHIRGGRSTEVSYMVDGVEMTDVFSGDVGVEVENASVQELQVISGTFNAEYGRAMSGVINIVTKTGGDKIGGSVTLYGGDYLSNGTDVFPHIDELNVLGVGNAQFSLDGPIPFAGNKMKFFLNGRYLNDDGYIFGTRVFNPSDSSNVAFDNPADYIIEATGDSAAVPMQFLKRKTLQGKLSYNFKPTMKLSGNFILNDIVTRDWSQEGAEFTPENQFHDFYRFMLNPDGASKQYKKAYNFILSWDHVLSDRTFYNLNLSSIKNTEKSYVYADPFDPRYIDPKRLIPPLAAGNTFYTGGTDMWHSERSTITRGLKLDVTSQVTNTHQVKGGAEIRSHELNFEEFKIIPAKNESGIEIQPFQPALPPRESPFNNRYTHRPKEVALYLQDKMEFDFMIVNLGLRYDLFDPNAPVPTDYSDPSNPEKLASASIKSQISPRLGVAYPISDHGVLHFSYGYFFQMPPFRYLYANSEFEVQIGRLQTLMGNADLNPQRTIVYEVGLQQQLSSDLAIDVTMFYKDIRDLLGTKIEQTLQGDRYARYINRDFGNARGLVFALNQRHSNWMSAGIDYTFQIAEGNASEPNAAFIDSRANREPEKRMVPLDWDQRHTLNASLTLSPSRNSNITLLGRYGSGLPYTPKFLNVRRAFENTARSKPTFTLDLQANYDVKLAGLTTSFFLRVFNLTDRRNEVVVYPSTGRAGFNLESLQSGTPKGINTVEEFYTNPSFHFAAPRQVRLGVTFRF